MGWKDVTPSDEVSAADWIGGRLLPFRDARIGSVIPTGFEAYVRSEQRLGLAALLARHTTTPNAAGSAYGTVTATCTAGRRSPIYGRQTIPMQNHLHLLPRHRP